LATVEDLRRLAGELKSASSPIGQMKILTRGWKLLRSMGGKERRWLATRIGFEGAEELIEGLAKGQGRLGSKALLRVLRKVKGASQAEVDEFIDALGDPEKRKDRLVRGLDEAERRLLEEPGPAKEPVAPETVAIPLAEKKPAKKRIRKTRREEVSQPAESNRAQKAVAVAAAVPLAAAPAPRPVAVKPQRAAPPPPVASPPSKPVITPPIEDPLIDRIRSAEHVMARLLLLRREVAAARDLSLEQLSELLELFRADWSRRRALTCLLEARVPQQLHQAIYLIESLDRATSRRWCLNTILHEWPLPEQERLLLEERTREILSKRAG
jgi:hypothetical protein